MLRKIAARAACTLAFLLVTISGAYAQGRVDGKVLDLNGNPFVGVTLEFKSAETGQSYAVKTDKEGKYIQLGVTPGTYDITIVDKGTPIFTQKYLVKNQVENTLDINLKELAAAQAAAQAAAHPEEVKKKEDAENKFKDLKTQFEAAKAAMAEAADLRKQLKATPADQKPDVQQKLDAALQTSITAFQKAEQDVTEKDVNNHTTILASLGEVYQIAGRYDESAAAYQKAIDLKPIAGDYSQMSLSQVNAAVALTDPNAMRAKMDEAAASCNKAIALDSTLAAMCWKNMGIVLTNTGHLPQAITSLQKATQANPKDAESWFLFGGALTNTIDTKQEGEKLIYIIPPGTADAYQKCIDAAPAGPYAPQCKAALDQLVQLSGGEDTKVSKKKKS
jgi:tetratricopeptide (TPR) repeat protein